MVRIEEAIPLRQVTDAQELVELESRLAEKAVERSIDVAGCYVARPDGHVCPIEGRPVKVKLLRIVGETGNAISSLEEAVFVNGEYFCHWESFM